MRRFLADRAAVSTALRDADILPDGIAGRLEAVKRWEGEPLDIVQRIDLGPETVIALSLDGVTVIHRVAMAIRRRGIEMRLIIPADGGAASKADPAFVKAIARARAWFDDLVSGRAESLSAIARRDGLSDRYVSHLLPLAFLAPEIVSAIADGRHPAELTAETLVKRLDLPLAWDDQRALLGFT